jgi:hypothetical protein
LPVRKILYPFVCQNLKIILSCLRMNAINLKNSSKHGNFKQLYVNSAVFVSPDVSWIIRATDEDDDDVIFTTDDLKTSLENAHTLTEESTLSAEILMAHTIKNTSDDVAITLDETGACTFPHQTVHSSGLQTDTVADTTGNDAITLDETGACTFPHQTVHSSGLQTDTVADTTGYAAITLDSGACTFPHQTVHSSGLKTGTIADTAGNAAITLDSGACTFPHQTVHSSGLQTDTIVDTTGSATITLNSGACTFSEQTVHSNGLKTDTIVDTTTGSATITLNSGACTFSEQTVHSNGLQTGTITDTTTGNDAITLNSGACTFPHQTVHSSGIDCGGDLTVSGNFEPTSIATSALTVTIDDEQTFTVDSTGITIETDTFELSTAEDTILNMKRSVNGNNDISPMITTEATAYNGNYVFSGARFSAYNGTTGYAGVSNDLVIGALCDSNSGVHNGDSGNGGIISYSRVFAIYKHEEVDGFDWTDNMSIGTGGGISNDAMTNIVYIDEDNAVTFAGSVTATTVSDAGTLDFTGQHRSVPEDTSINYADKVGYIVCSTGQYSSISADDNINYGKDAIMISEALPLVKLSASAMDKRVYGVISNIEDDGKRTYHSGSFISTLEKKEGDNRLYINSIGEGAMWVCNANGNLVNGDYICASDIEGLGMKQDSEFLANYTVAKITMDCDFNPSLVNKKTAVTTVDGKLEFQDTEEEEFEYETASVSGTAYTMAFVGVTYHCG